MSRQISLRRTNCLILVLSIAAGGNVLLLAQSTPPNLAAGYREFYAGNLVEAARIAEGSVRANPRSVEARILLARTRMVVGQVPGAYEELRRAYLISPRNIDVLYFLGLAANIMAQGEYSQLFKMAPESGRAHQLQGEMYQLQEKAEKAMEEYEAAVKANPELVDVWLAMGDLARSELQYDKAISCYQRAQEIRPTNYDALYGLGACYQQQDPQKALEYFNRAVQVAPNETESRLALGDVLLKTNRYAEALKQLQVAIQQDPKLRQAYILMGRAQKGLGQDAEAEQSFKKAQELVQTELETRRGTIRKGIAQPTPPIQEKPSIGPGEPPK
jgi:tetratricopeptide (TPR) repeat protein